MLRKNSRGKRFKAVLVMETGENRFRSHAMSLRDMVAGVRGLDRAQLHEYALEGFGGRVTETEEIDVLRRSNRLADWVLAVWPKELAVQAPAVSQHLAKLPALVPDRFSEIVDLVSELVGAIEHGDMVLGDLEKEELASLHPEKALILVDRITPDTPRPGLEILRARYSASRRWRPSSSAIRGMFDFSRSLRRQGSECSALTPARSTAASTAGCPPAI